MIISLEHFHASNFSFDENKYVVRKKNEDRAAYGKIYTINTKYVVFTAEYNATRGISEVLPQSSTKKINDAKILIQGEEFPFTLVDIGFVGGNEMTFVVWGNSNFQALKKMWEHWDVE